MPNIKSAKKRVKVIETKTLQNRATKKAYKEAIKNFEAAVKENASNKEELYNEAISKIDNFILPIISAGSDNYVPKLPHSLHQTQQSLPGEASLYGYLLLQKYPESV